MKCRHCGKELELCLVDLASSPPSNSYLNAEALNKPEQWFPLRVMVCQSCWLAQTEDFVSEESLFNDTYAYFSSYSNSWLEHAKNYCDNIVSRLGLSKESFVVEIASNDGYLLQYFKEKKIPNLGIEPTKAVAEACLGKGIDTLQAFFTMDLASQLSGKNMKADLVIANNVLAHVPDINDFICGIYEILKPNGVATFEFPHLLELIEKCQFDTIYHEHFSYISLTAACKLFNSAGLKVIDVEQLSTHGGSLRVFVQKVDANGQRSQKVADLLDAERQAGMLSTEYYSCFQNRAEKIKDSFLEFLLKAKSGGQHVVAYGAAAKGNTLLNFAGIHKDLLSFVVDRNPYKQNKFLPGSRIPIVDEENIKLSQPGYIVILPWNLRKEISAQLDYAREWGVKFVVAVPRLEVF